MAFLATMPAEISRIAQKYMTDPHEIAVGKRNAGADNVKHDFYLVQAKINMPHLNVFAILT